MRAGIIASARASASLTDGFVTNVDSATNISAGGNYTFNNVNIGTADATRRVIVGLAGRDTATLPSSLTIGGVSANLDIGEGNTPIAGIYSLVVASGASATIVATFAAMQTFCSLGVWVVYGKSLISTAEFTANSTTPTANLSTQAGDFCVGMVAFRATSTAIPAFTWNAATVRFDGPGDGSVRSRSGADMIATGATTDMGGTIVNPFSTTESALVAAAYR